MKKFVEKIKAWFKGINWKKVGCAVLASVGVGIVVSVLKKANEKLSIEALNDPDYGMKLWTMACDEFKDDGGIEKFNEEWFKGHPDFDVNNDDHIQAQTDALDEMLKPYLDKVAKENSIDGYMLDFDKHEPVLFKPVTGHKDWFTSEIHATIKKID